MRFFNFCIVSYSILVILGTCESRNIISYLIDLFASGDPETNEILKELDSEHASEVFESNFPITVIFNKPSPLTCQSVIITNLTRKQFTLREIFSLVRRNLGFLIMEFCVKDIFGNTYIMPYEESTRASLFMVAAINNSTVTVFECLYE
ncbi:hypothetical protein Ddc_14942 [Ditylenchus destructor]|nr:hypothetical protein Ddc_14942 [Ditylenchus destructor]